MVVADVSLTDEELVKQYRLSKNELILEELMKRTLKLRYKLANNYLNIPDSEFEDLLSEGLISLLEAIDRYTGVRQTKFKSFLYAVIEQRYNNLYAQAMSKKRCADLSSFDQMEEFGESGGGYGSVIFSVECQEFKEIEVLDVLHHAGLSKHELIAVRLIMQGYSQVDVAKRLGVSSVAIHSYRQRAKVKLIKSGIA